MQNVRERMVWFGEDASRNKQEPSNILLSI